MQAEIIVHGFETSNNMKVRVALGYKGIAYEFRTIEPGDRSEIVKISGQHLTPVMQHGEVVLFDSAAILRYLDANFPDTPKLFGDSHAEQWALEDVELFARTQLAGPMLAVVHRRVAGEEVTAEFLAGRTTEFERAATELAGKLGDRRWLFGDRMTAADITAAAVLHRIRLAELFTWPAAAERIEEWLGRVMAFDGQARVS